MGYFIVLEAGTAENAAAADVEALQNAGLLVGVDVTAPSVEFLAASLKDGATAITNASTVGTACGGPGWRGTHRSPRREYRSP